MSHLLEASVPVRAVSESFSEYRVGLDEVSFGCANRGELEQWARRLDELAIQHGGIKDATYGSGVSFRDPTASHSNSSPHQAELLLG